MMFQIHYEQDAERRTAEVEAHSPSEAVVKFESVQQSRGATHGRRMRVTSVVANNDPLIDDQPW